VMGMMIFLLIGLTTGASAAKDPCSRDSDAMAQTSGELLGFYQGTRTDYAEQSPDQDANNKKRIKSVWKMYKAGEICTPVNKMHASWVLSRSRDVEHNKVAHELAKDAMMHHVQEAAWLTAISFDRWFVSRGMEQRYGTQRSVEDGRLCLFPIKEGATDQERVQYGHQPIAEVYQTILDASGIAGPATAATLRQRNLFCDLKPW
jgi:hypothetical protein